MERFEFFATCPEGFERALADELRGMGLRSIRPLKGRVSFTGGAVDGERACLWSRLASRIIVTLGRFDAIGADELYEGVYALSWEDILRRGASLAVTARGTTPELRNTHFTALKAKDAICDRLADETGRRADIDTERPDARITLALRSQRVTLSLDLSGEPLFRRMPRMATKPDAPAHFLRPDYASLMLAQGGWNVACADETAVPALVDACCAGGGVAIEAAAILADRAPGLSRRHWGFFGWAAHDADAWDELLAEAREREVRAGARKGRIIATDVNGTAALFARRVAREAGFGGIVSFVQPNANEIARELTGATPAILVLDTTEASFTKVGRLVELVGELRRSGGAGDMPTVALTRDEFSLHALGKPERELAVRPGNEEAKLLTFAAQNVPYGSSAAIWHQRGQSGAAAADTRQGNRAESRPNKKTGEARLASFSWSQAPAASVDLGRGKPVPVLFAESEQFANRLKKNARRYRKWARQAGVTCYRVYDADLPDYAAAIDLYEGSAATPGRWLVIAEYAAPKSIDPALARARLMDILAIAPVALDVDPACVYARARTRSRGGSQYGRREEVTADTRAVPLIEEGGLTFEVNFDSYLDTGIFLDHRATRSLVRERIRQLPAPRFLNLFAYTGTATCYAADGGAAETVTVDLSNTYLDWAQRNMEANGFTGSGHHFVRADVLRWIAEQQRTGNRWDLIFCDPPTFSNSAKMGQRTWDVQRDHVELLTGVSSLLAPGGEAIFSCNLRTFKPDVEGLARAGVELEDITATTIPEDFARNPKIHHCYIVKRR